MDGSARIKAAVREMLAGAEVKRRVVAEALGVAETTVKAWCAPSNPRLPTAPLLLELMTGPVLPGPARDRGVRVLLGVHHGAHGEHGGRQ